MKKETKERKNKKKKRKKIKKENLERFQSSSDDGGGPSLSTFQLLLLKLINEPSIDNIPLVVYQNKTT